VPLDEEAICAAAPSVEPGTPLVLEVAEMPVLGPASVDPSCGGAAGVSGRRAYVVADVPEGMAIEISSSAPAWLAVSQLESCASETCTGSAQVDLGAQSGTALVPLSGLLRLTVVGGGAETLTLAVVAGPEPSEDATGEPVDADPDPVEATSAEPPSAEPISGEPTADASAAPGTGESDGGCSAGSSSGGAPGLPLLLLLAAWLLQVRRRTRTSA